MDTHPRHGQPARRFAVAVVMAVIVVLLLGESIVFARSSAVQPLLNGVSPIVAIPNATVVVRGLNFPAIPVSDVGVSTTSPYLNVYDSRGWSAGFSGDLCPVTIGSASPDVIVLQVNTPLVCGHAIAPGDSVTFTLYSGPGGIASGCVAGACSVKAVPASSSPTVSGVSPTYGLAGGGTNTKLSGSFLSAPEAVWFGTPGSVDYAAVPQSSTGGTLAVQTPSVSARYPSGQQIPVIVATTMGASAPGCPVVIQLGCVSSFAFLSSSSGSVNLPATNVDGSLGIGQETNDISGTNACGGVGNGSIGSSLTVDASYKGGPVALAYSGGTATGPSLPVVIPPDPVPVLAPTPQAVAGVATLTVGSQVTIDLSISGAVQGCGLVPIPSLALPYGLGGVYVAIGGDVALTVGAEVVIHKGTYTASGRWIPGQPGGAVQITGASSCVDANGNPTSPCVGSSLTSTFGGKVSLTFPWLQVGPSSGWAHVGIGFGVGAQGQFGILGQPSSQTPSDICAAVYADAGVDLDIPGFKNWSISADVSSTLLGPWNLWGNATVCAFSGTASPGKEAQPTISLAPPATTGTTVSLNGIAQATAPATIGSVTCDWGDGTRQSSGLFPFSHTYAGSGSFPIVCNATDSNGLSATASATVIIPGQGDTPPSIRITPAVNGNTVSVNGITLPTTPGATITSIRWTWGDGMAGTQWFPAVHVYGAPGTYPVTVTAIDSKGLSATASATVTIP